MIFMSQVGYCVKRRLCHLSLLKSLPWTSNAQWNLLIHVRARRCPSRWQVQNKHKGSDSIDTTSRVDPAKANHGRLADDLDVETSRKSNNLSRTLSEKSSPKKCLENSKIQLQSTSISNDEIKLTSSSVGFRVHAESKSDRDLVVAMKRSVEHRRVVNVYTDASGRHGLGCVWDKKWIVSRWDQEWLSDHRKCLELLEMIAIKVAVLTWGHQWSGFCVRVHCDNRMVVDCFQGKARVKRRLAEVYDCIRTAAAEQNIQLEVELANKSIVQFQGTDRLSKMDFFRFFKLLPNMNNVPDHPPDNLAFLFPNLWEDICVSVKLRII